MEKLDVIARAAAGIAHSPPEGFWNRLRRENEYHEGAWVNVSVSRASDGEPITGLTQADFLIDLEWEFSAGPDRADISVFLEEAAMFASSLPGFYLLGVALSGGAWWNRGIYFVQVAVRSGERQGQTLTTLRVTPK